MLIYDEGSLCVWISKEPKQDATDDNIARDFHQLVVTFLLKYVDEEDRRPPYLTDFLNWIKKITSETDDYKRGVNRWVLRHQPFLVQSVKWRVFIEDFYTFYKTVHVDSVHDRNDLIAGMNTYICDRWHLNIVSRDSFLDLVYWKDNEHKRPHNYYTTEITPLS